MFLGIRTDGEPGTECQLNVQALYQVQLMITCARSHWHFLSTKAWKWTESCDLRGKVAQDHGCRTHPLPIQRPIPKRFGGTSDPVMRRLARIGDGWFPSEIRP